MATLTHVQCMAAFKHITHTIMEQDDGSPLLKALAYSGIDNIYDLLCLNKQQIDALEYDDSGTMKMLDDKSKVAIVILKAHVWHRRLNGNRIYNDYLSVTLEGFDDSWDRLVHFADFSSALRDIQRMELKVKGSNEEEDVIRAEETAKENVPRELEQPDLKEKSALAVKEHDKDIGRYYNKTDKYEEYKHKVFLVMELWQQDPPPPEQPPKPPQPEPPPPKNNGL